jgi:hypothetical protein
MALPLLHLLHQLPVAAALGQSTVHSFAHCAHPAVPEHKEQQFLQMKTWDPVYTQFLHEMCEKAVRCVEPTIHFAIHFYKRTF